MSRLKQTGLVEQDERTHGALLHHNTEQPGEYYLQDNIIPQKRVMLWYRSQHCGAPASSREQTVRDTLEMIMQKNCSSVADLLTSVVSNRRAFDQARTQRRQYKYRKERAH